MMRILSAILIGLPIMMYLWRRPVTLVQVALLAVLFARTIHHFIGIGLVGYLDDAGTILVVLRAIVARLSHELGSTRHRYPGIYFFLGFATLGVGSAAVGSSTHFSTVIPATYLALKGILFGWAVAQFIWTEVDVLRLIRRAAYVATFVAAAGALNLVAPYSWARVFSVSGDVITRYGLPSVTGPFIHPFDFAFAASASAIAIYAYHAIIRPTRFTRVMVPILWIGTVLTWRRKDLVGLVGATTVVAAIARRWTLIVLGGLSLTVGVITQFGFLSAQVRAIDIAYLSADSQEARSILVQGALRIATEHFPFGVGFGYYGSRIAATDYSPIYLQLGFPYRYGLGPGFGQGAFLTDTSWPAVIGESGYIGAAAFCLGIASMAGRMRQLRRESGYLQRWVGATGIGWIVLVLAESSAGSVFTSPPLYPFMFGIVGLGVAISGGAVGQTTAQLRERGRGSRCQIAKDRRISV